MSTQMTALENLVVQELQEKLDSGTIFNPGEIEVLGKNELISALLANDSDLKLGELTTQSKSELQDKLTQQHHLLLDKIRRKNKLFALESLQCDPTLSGDCAPVTKFSFMENELALPGQDRVITTTEVDITALRDEVQAYKGLVQEKQGDFRKFIQGLILEPPGEETVEDLNFSFSVKSDLIKTYAMRVFEDEDPRLLKTLGITDSNDDVAFEVKTKFEIWRYFDPMGTSSIPSNLEEFFSNFFTEFFDSKTIDMNKLRHTAILIGTPIAGPYTQTYDGFDNELSLYRFMVLCLTNIDIDELKPCREAKRDLLEPVLQPEKDKNWWRAKWWTRESEVESDGRETQLLENTAECGKQMEILLRKLFRQYEQNRDNVDYNQMLITLQLLLVWLQNFISQRRPFANAIDSYLELVQSVEEVGRDSNALTQDMKTKIIKMMPELQFAVGMILKKDIISMEQIKNE